MSSHLNFHNPAHKPVFESFVTGVWSWRTGEAVEGQPVHSVFCGLVIIWQDYQGKLIIVQRVTSDDTQVVQWDHWCVVQSYENVASDFFNGLEKRSNKKKKRKVNSNFTTQPKHTGLHNPCVKHLSIVKIHFLSPPVPLPSLPRLINV